MNTCNNDYTNMIINMYSVKDKDKDKDISLSLL